MCFFASGSRSFTGRSSRTVMRVFLEVSSLASKQGLWSLEFVFDEDDGRVARIEARFWDARIRSAGPLRSYRATRCGS